MQGSCAPSGALALRVIRSNGHVSAPRVASGWPARELSLAEIVRYGMPQQDEPQAVRQWRLRNTRHLWRGVRRVLAARAQRLPHFYGQLYLDIIRTDGTVEHLGLASMRVVTTAGVNFIVDAFQNLTELENLKFHGIGTGSVAEAAGDTALGTELTTQYQTDNTRATGTTTEGASANVYRSVGTNTVDAAVSITEHGILSQAATGGGTLLDRSVFTAVALANGDSLQTTYDFTVSSGG